MYNPHWVNVWYVWVGLMRNSSPQICSVFPSGAALYCILFSCLRYIFSSQKPSVFSVLFASCTHCPWNVYVPKWSRLEPWALLTAILFFAIYRMYILSIVLIKCIRDTVCSDTPYYYSYVPILWKNRDCEWTIGVRIVHFWTFFPAHIYIHTRHHPTL